MHQNPFLWKEPGISIAILLPSPSVPSNSHPMAHYMNFSTKSCSMVKFSETPYHWEEPEILIPILFSRYELFLFRQTFVPWDSKNRRSPQFFQNMFLLPHTQFPPNGLQSNLLFMQHYGTRKTFENFLALKFLL